MATYSLGNFINDPSPNDRFMMIYNSADVLVCTIDPYSSTFFQKSKYIYIVTDGKMNYDNVLDFSIESEGAAALARLNDVKKLFIDRTNNTLSTTVNINEFSEHTGNTNLHITSIERSALNETNNLSDSNPFATIADISIASGDTKQVKVSGGDDTEGYLENKLTGSTYITLDVLNNNSAETLRMSVVGLTPLTTFYNHTGNTTNPHQVTIEQISGVSLSVYSAGLNISIYNAFTGITAPNTYATIVDLNNHTGNTNNPHNVTLFQLSGVSLSTYNTYTGNTLLSLSAYTLLLDYDIFSGTTIPDTYATITNLNNHTGNTSNPHNVTTSQLSAYTMIEVNSNFLSATTTVVDLGGYSATTIDSLITGVTYLLNNHTGNTSNPHNVTLIQLSGVSLSVYNTFTGTTVPNTYATITNLNNHTGNTSNPHNVTLTQLSGYTMSQVNSNFLSANTSIYWTSGSTGTGSIKTLFASGSTGAYSIATGFQTIASENYSIATGNKTTSSGKYSHAEGYNTIASVNYSNASGYYSTASGYYSKSSGFDTTASGIHSTASGVYSTASGSHSTASGNYSTASGGYSNASGSYSTASGFYSIARGNNSTASGIHSTASGYYSIASGNYSTSSGQYSDASGNHSTASGYRTVASGHYSTASGYYATVNGNYSHAGGYYSIASGTSSFIHSTSSIVIGDRSVVLGGQNITGSSNDTVYVPYLNIGNIVSGTTINNLGIDSSGKVIIGSTTDLSSYYTSAQTNENFLSANTSFYTQSQANDNFLSANTSIVSLTVYNTYTGTTVPNTYSTISNLNVHTGNTNNPHNVTTLQLSAYTITECDAKFVDISGDTMTGPLSFSFMTGTTSRTVHVDSGGTLIIGDEFAYLYITATTLINELENISNWSNNTYIGDDLSNSGLTEGQKYITTGYSYEYLNSNIYRNVANSYTIEQTNDNFLSANTSIVNLSIYNTFTGTTVPNTYTTIIDFNNHTGNTNNPHNVTLIQLSGVSLSVYNTFTGTTVPNTYATISNLNNHTGNTNNPHQVTFTGLTATAHTHTYNDINNRFTYSNLTSSTYIIDTFSTIVTDGCHWHYVIRDGVNVEAGTIIGGWDLNSSAVTHTQYSTDELGNTSGISFEVDINTNNIRLLSTIVSGNWNIKIRRFDI